MTFESIERQISIQRETIRELRRQVDELQAQRDAYATEGCYIRLSCDEAAALADWIALHENPPGKPFDLIFWRLRAFVQMMKRAS